MAINSWQISGYYNFICDSRGRANKKVSPILFGGCYRLTDLDDAVPVWKTGHTFISLKLII